MKKLFTFLMLAAFVVMGFAQQRISPIDHEHYVGNISSIDRSDWYGSFSWESGFRQTAAEDAYYLVIDADEIPAGAVLEKVYFIHVYNASISCTNTAYTINLYRNPSVDDQGHLNPGESIFSQDYTAPMETDAQQVPFTTPYTVVAGESLCIGIVMDGTSVPPTQLNIHTILQDLQLEIPMSSQVIFSVMAILKSMTRCLSPWLCTTTMVSPM